MLYKIGLINKRQDIFKSELMDEISKLELKIEKSIKHNVAELTNAVT